MQKAVILVPLLVLGWTWTPQGIPVTTEPLYTTQENFNLAQFLGTWYDVAVASTCPHMQSHRRDAAIGKLVLQSSPTAGKIKATRTVLRQGTCNEMSGDYDVTTTPGRFQFHIAKWNADVDAYVVHTNYNEYAIMILSKQKSSGNMSTSVKLYSRTRTVRATVLDDFKTLVRQQGMADSTIVTKQDKEACKAAPDTGPCFGLHRRYFYNASSMSCELFNYGGCLGNQNNFENERICLQRCRTEAVCRLPMAAQPCTGHPPIWAFDSSAGLCVPYKGGFCQTNANKFYTKAECEEYCGVEKGVIWCSRITTDPHHYLLCISLSCEGARLPALSSQSSRLLAVECWEYPERKGK
ncbi:Protein AMBP [Nibea albiflora]|uniref:Protein AMBP n=1 Tax=Nibea albiflora TaxID=240163 RepID=A0ACB7F8Z8_NIBAL|nr:Protein AMBP [Nibea albiflora]